MIWTREIWRAKVKFGLLATAVGLLFFLLVFVNTLSSTLLDQFIGAIENSSADVLVFDSEAQATIPASRLSMDEVERVAAVEGVAVAAPISVLATEAELAEEAIDVSLWGLEIEGPGTPTDLVEGGYPEDNEALVDTSAREAGFTVGEIVDVGGVSIEIVGVAENATYSVAPTLYVTNPTWSEAFSGLFPQAPAAPVNLIGVAVDVGIDAGTAATDISALDGLEGLLPAQAAAATPGVSSIEQSFALITGITFVIVAVVVGFFFQILTVQKLRVFALLEALGSRFRSLVSYVLTQIGFLVTLGMVVGVAMLAGAVVLTRDVFAISIDPLIVALFGGAILLATLLSGFTSIRRIAKQDAASVATGGSR
ncbi:MAG TPA: FtsX-like permease family protein [Acidimicrobiia bacterium]|nr:FtsX-like permease family protein [Acidimicrobiia bacterium]